MVLVLICCEKSHHLKILVFTEDHFNHYLSFICSVLSSEQLTIEIIIYTLKPDIKLCLLVHAYYFVI